MSQEESKQELPDYKQKFLEYIKGETSESQEFGEGEQLTESHYNQIAKMRKITNENDIWNSGQYLDDKWKKEINATFYRIKHNEKVYPFNADMNPETEELRFNRRKTQISEYSNALHNNRVFINPKFQSC